MGESSSLPFAVWIHTSVESSAGRSPRLMPIAAARPPTHEMSGAWLTVTRWMIRGRLPSYGASGLTPESHPTSSIPARMIAAAALKADFPLLRIRLCNWSRSPWLWRAGRQPRYASAAAGEEGTKALSGAWYRHEESEYSSPRESIEERINKAGIIYANVCAVTNL